MIIPHEDLAEETLISLIESFILREGTDYGDTDVSLEAKTQQILNQVKTDKIIIVYSELHESCDLVPATKIIKN